MESSKLLKACRDKKESLHHIAVHTELSNGFQAFAAGSADGTAFDEEGRSTAVFRRAG
jgi:hypothetical protein